MNKFLITIALVTIALASCKNNNAGSVTEGTAKNTYGKEITADNAITIESAIASLETQDSLVTKIKGKVESVCQVKGCWMNLLPDSGNEDDAIFVKFKDYAFFMPLDLAGKEVVIEGVAYREVTSVDELKHYAEDEGLPQEEIDKITEPKEELKFMADGVIIL